MKRSRNAPTCDAGFTVLELMAIVAIIGILLSVAIATFVPASQSAAAAACRMNQRVLEEAFSRAMYTADTEPPEDIDDLAPYVNNINRINQCPLDSTPLTLDGVTGDVVCPNHP